jgi:hypothetical protein
MLIWSDGDSNGGSGITSYSVYVAEGTGDFVERAGGLPPTPREYRVSGLVEGTQYRFQV